MSCFAASSGGPLSRHGIYLILYAYIFSPPAARDASIEVALRPHPVASVPEGYGGAYGPLPALAARNCYGVRAPTVGAHEFMCEGVRLATLRIITDDVGSIVTFDSQQLTVVQPPRVSFARSRSGGL